MIRRALLVLAPVLAACGGAGDAGKETGPPNVLFIAVDDLRPLLGCYGDEVAHSPNIDRLAESSLLFERAYCQQAVCSPSRISVMTGLRPETTGIRNNVTPLREVLPDVVTVSQHFKDHGWRAEAFGKIYHQGDEHRDPASWSAPERRYDNWEWRNPESLRAIEERRAGLDLDSISPEKAAQESRGPSHEWADVPDDAYADGRIARDAAARLGELAEGDEPFFLAVGFMRPHLPFNAPKRWWDAIDADAVELPAFRRAAINAPAWQLANWGELRTYSDISKQSPIGDEQALALIHAYRASVAYMDAQVGLVLDALDASGAADNTIVVLWSDHGWKLGEYGSWCKHSNVEFDVRVPLLARVPGMAAAGRKTPALVELVDLYPSLCDAAGLPLPEHLEGTSFVPLLEDPTLPWKAAAFSSYPRHAFWLGARRELIGHSMRTDIWRFTRWSPTADPEDTASYELYDHRIDPEERRSYGRSPDHAGTIYQLQGQLLGGWAEALPPGAAPREAEEAPESPEAQSGE